MGSVLSKLVLLNWLDYIIFIFDEVSFVGTSELQTVNWKVSESLYSLYEVGITNQK